MAKTIPAHVNLHWHCKVRQDGLLDPRDFDAFELNNIPWDDHSVMFFVMTRENYGPAYAKTVEEKVKLLLKVKAKSALKMDAYFIWPGKYSSDLFYINRASIDAILRRLGYLTEEEKAKSLQTEYKALQVAMRRSDLVLHRAIRENNALKDRLSTLERKAFGNYQIKEDVNYDDYPAQEDFG